MEWLNYHHLLYFWAVAREGSVTGASAYLHLAQSTISGQIRALEDALGEKLFIRVGRNLMLSEVGQVVFRYADEIFALGRELMDTLHGRPTGRPLRLVVGVVDVLPKLIAYRLLEPALRLPVPVHIVCHEGKQEHLLAELAVYNLDVVLSDAPSGPLVKIQAFHHLLGDSGVTFFGTPQLAAAYCPGFPGSLEGAPCLLPTDNTMLRHALDHWFEAEGVRPLVVGEYEDSALLKVFGQAGIGIFAMPSVIEAEIQRQYDVQVIGRVEAVRERFYAISVERQLRHPAVIAMSETVGQEFFHEKGE